MNRFSANLVAGGRLVVTVLGHRTVY